MKARLVVVLGKPRGKKIALHEGQFLIGRGRDCQLRPNSELVSRHHCCIMVDESSIRVREMGSTNGTFVNGKAITKETELSNGDLLTVGPLTFALTVRGKKPEGQEAAEPRRHAPTIGAEDIASDEQLADWLDVEAEGEAAAAPMKPVGSETMVIDKSQLPDDLTMVQNGEDDEKAAEKRAKKKTQVLPEQSSRTTADAAGDLMRKYFQRSER